MGLQFERREKVARYLDPRNGYADAGLSCEVRRDPLTGRTGRVAHVLGFRLLPVDFGSMIEESRRTCPFCPDRIFEVTPKFPADVTSQGRFQRGEAVAFPNLAPYDEHSAVIAMTAAHYVPMSGFTPGQLGDAFGVCIDYGASVRRLPATNYALAFWNYLPASGGTQIHPHLQMYVTDTPGNAMEMELAASLRYARSEGRPYWADLIDEEERRGERFIARGRHTAWLASFVSESLLGDALVIFPGRRTMLDVSDAEMDEFCVGLTQVLRKWEADGIYSFNLGWYSGSAERDDFWLHARISPRVYMAPKLWGVDTSSLQHLYDEHFMVRTPEDAAEALRGAVHFS